MDWIRKNSNCCFNESFFYCWKIFFNNKIYNFNSLLLYNLSNKRTINFRSEWIGLERIQIAVSMNPSSTVGRYSLTTRFTTLIRCCYITYPTREQLISDLNGLD